LPDFFVSVDENERGQDVGGNEFVVGKNVVKEIGCVVKKRSLEKKLNKNIV
jgi:hypothetical protein